MLSTMKALYRLAMLSALSTIAFVLCYASAGAAITVVQSHNVYDNSANNNVTGTLTASPTVGDLLVAIVDLGAGDICIVNAGWTQISRQSGQGGMTLADRVVQSGDTGSNLPVICHGLGSGGDWNASIIELAGVATNTVDVNAIGTTSVSGSQTAISSGSITTTINGDFVLTSMQINTQAPGPSGQTPTYTTSQASTSQTLAFNDSTHNGSGANQQVGYSFVNPPGPVAGVFTYSIAPITSAALWSIVAFAPANPPPSAHHGLTTMGAG
jgi:hypothetical protein